jgi:glutamate carboxypeptidase
VVSHANADLGDTIVGTIERDASGLTVILIGHLDTVFEPGTSEERPFAIRDGRAYGPGVSDMKAGLLTGLHALAALRATAAARQPEASDVSVVSWLPVGRLVFIANPDEEIGSPASMPVIREQAALADVALVLEGARENGDIVSSRKGHLELRLDVHGRAAHAGVEPEKGRSAVLEVAHKIVNLQDLNGRFPGVTVNVGVVNGGTRPNIVAESASIQIDVRALTRRDLEAIEAAIRVIAEASVVPDVSSTVEVVTRHWPMERTTSTARLVEHAVRVAAELGFDLSEAATGGASDGNTTAGLGVPTIDGLGPIGGRDHSPDEYLELDSIVPRTTLLAGLLRAIASDPLLPRSRP